MTGDLYIAHSLFQPHLNQLQGPEGTVHLEPRSTAVLAELATHAGEVRTREEILEAVWGDAFVGEAVLTHCIWELRKAFADDARDPKVIQTVPRRGYRLIAMVREATSTAVETVLRAELYDNAGARIGDPLADDRSRDLLARLATGHPGRPTREDNHLLLYFDRPVEAVSFAVSLHDELGISAMSARVSIHLDEVATAPDLPPPDREPATNLGFRLMASALSGQTLLTRGAFDLARRAQTIPNLADDPPKELRWLAHGPFLFQGLDEPMEIFEVGVEGSAPLRPPPPSHTARPAGGSTILGWRPAPGLTVPSRPHWELIEKLGEGGFGEVWLTRHRKTGDRRAFKFCFEAERLKALQREVTLFRLLKETLGDRPDIVHLLDWNFDTAPYFLEIEHTASGSLVDWAAGHGGLQQVPFELRLELVAQAAESLAAAHSVGVLHKDVKPANLLVYLDPDGEPKIRISDFGIGHILERKRLLEAGITGLGLQDTGEESSSGGTGLYIAPEVLEGKAVSTAADVYGLGVLLYQMVIGELDRAVATGWQRHVNDEVLASDIAACVDGSPENRPGARELADRLRRLDQRHEQKLREEREWDDLIAGQQALQQARRRRRQWATAAVVATGVSILVSLFAWQAVSARAAADRNRSRAEDLVSFMLGDLRRTLASVGRLDAMDGAVDQVLAYFDTFDTDQLTDHDLTNRAEALRQLGEVRLGQGRLEDARGHFDRSTELARRLVQRDPTATTRQAGYANSRFWSGFVLERIGDFSAAESAYREHWDCYRKLAREQTDNKDWRLEVAYGHHNLGQLAARRGDLTDALSQHRKGQSLLLALIADFPDDPELRFELATNHNRVGAIEQRGGQLAPALDEFRADLRLLEELLTEKPADTRIRERYASAVAFTGSALWMLGRPQAALDHFRNQVNLRRTLSELDPDNADWQRYLSVAQGQLGMALAATGAPEEALVRLTAGRSRLETLLAEGYRSVRARRELAVLLRLEGEARLQIGQTETAADAARRSIELLESLRRDTPDDLAVVSRLSRSFGLLGSALASHDPEAAAAAWRLAAEVVEPLAAGSRDPQLLDPLARALLATGHRDQARPLIEQLTRGGYREITFAQTCREAGLWPDRPPESTSPP